MNDIATWFLLLSLFFPRITLLIAYFTNSIPANNIPFIGDLFMAILVPRVLVLLYIFTNLGFGGWFIVHLLFLLGAMTVTVKKSSKSKRS
jgi:hypothetical protein